MKIASHLEARAHSCVRDKRALQAQAWHHWRVAPIGARRPLARGTCASRDGACGSRDGACGSMKKMER